MSYVGATKRLTLSEARSLPSNWALQPKIDGCYATVHTDEDGCVEALYSRTGKEYETPGALSLHGCRIATRRAVLVGELEDHTEWGCAQFKRQGYSNIHLFDALSVDGYDLRSESYATRRDRLWRCHSSQLETRDRHWQQDISGQVRDILSGRYCKATPTAWRRAPIVPQVGLMSLNSIWSDYVEQGGEGLVAVNLTSAAGKRGSKKKIKQADGIDCIVERIEGKRVRLRTFGRVFSVGRNNLDLLRGQTVTVLHDGSYSDGLPRFPRIERIRQDLA